MDIVCLLRSVYISDDLVCVCVRTQCQCFCDFMKWRRDWVCCGILVLEV